MKAIDVLKEIQEGCYLEWLDDEYMVWDKYFSDALLVIIKNLESGVAFDNINTEDIEEPED